jgi:hypothetical protein
VAPKKTAAAEATPDEKSSGAPKPFVWKPSDGSPDIELPNAVNAVSKNRALRFFYRMNKLQGNFVGQMQFALESAGVAESIQDRIFDLDDDEITDLVTAWSADLTGASPGES